MGFIKKALIGYGVLKVVSGMVVTRVLNKHGISIHDYFRIVFKGPKDFTEVEKIHSLYWMTIYSKEKEWKKQVDLDILCFYVTLLKAACDRNEGIVS